MELKKAKLRVPPGIDFWNPNSKVTDWMNHKAGIRAINPLSNNLNLTESELWLSSLSCKLFAAVHFPWSSSQHVQCAWYLWPKSSEFIGNALSMRSVGENMGLLGVLSWSESELDNSSLWDLTNSEVQDGSLGLKSCPLSQSKCSSEPELTG